MADFVISLQDSVDTSKVVELQIGNYIQGSPGVKGDKGDKGDAGDITPELDAARDEAVASAADAATSAADAAAANAAIANGTATDAGALAGAEMFPLSRGSGVLKTTLTAIAEFAQAPFVVGSVTSLRGLSKLLYTRAFLAGYSAVGDGGQGEFWADLSDTSSVDNGFSIFVAGDGARWKLQHGGQLRAKQAGCVPSGASDTAAKLLQAMLWCAQNNVAFVVDDMYELQAPLMLTDAYSGLRVLKTGGGSGFKWASGVSFDPVDLKGLLMLKSTTELRDVYIAPLIYDGNKAGVVAPLDNTVHGISIIDNGGLYTRVVIDQPECRNNRGSGVSARSGGVDVRYAKCHDNTWHGVGIDWSANSTGETHFIEPDCRNNGAYGFDASGGKTVITGQLYAYGNTQGGSKTSTDCLKFKVNRMLLLNNTAYGFRTTGTAANLELDIGELEVSGTVSDGGANPGQSISIATGKLIRIGKITADGASSNGDTNIRIGGAARCDIGPIYSSNSPNTAVYLTGFLGSVESIVSVGAGKNGLLIDTASNVNIRGDVSLQSSNKLVAVSGNNQYALVNIGSTLNIAGRLAMTDPQGTPTQLKGVNAFSAAKNIIGSVTAAQMAATDVFTTSNTGTLVRVLGDASGVVMETYETILASGTGAATAFTLTLASPLTSIGGGVYEASVYANSNDANQYAFGIYQTAATLVRVRYATAPISGTNNLTFLVRVRVYISR